MWILACDETVGVTWECVMIWGKMLFNDIWDRGEFTCFTLIFYTTSLNSKWFYDRNFCFGVNGAMDKSESVFTGI